MTERKRAADDVDTIFGRIQELRREKRGVINVAGPSGNPTGPRPPHKNAGPQPKGERCGNGCDNLKPCPVHGGPSVPEDDAWDWGMYLSPTVGWWVPYDENMDTPYYSSGFFFI